MKKSKLVIDYEFDFELIGITSVSKGYKLAWALNQQFGTHLVKQADLMVGFKNNIEKGFPIYSHETQLNRLKLIKNKPADVESGKYFLIPEFPHFDYIIVVSLEAFPKSEILTAIKTIPSIELASIIPLDGLKSKSNFVF